MEPGERQKYIIFFLSNRGGERERGEGVQRYLAPSSFGVIHSEAYNGSSPTIRCSVSNAIGPLRIKSTLIPSLCIIVELLFTATGSCEAF